MHQGCNSWHKPIHAREGNSLRSVREDTTHSVLAFGIFGDIYLLELCVVKATLGALEILDVVAKHKDKLIVGSSALGFGDVDELS